MEGCKELYGDLVPDVTAFEGTQEPVAVIRSRLEKITQNQHGRARVLRHAVHVFDDKFGRTEAGSVPLADLMERGNRAAAGASTVGRVDAALIAGMRRAR